MYKLDLLNKFAYNSVSTQTPKSFVYKNSTKSAPTNKEQKQQTSIKIWHLFGVFLNKQLLGNFCDKISLTIRVQVGALKNNCIFGFYGKVQELLLF